MWINKTDTAEANRKKITMDNFLWFFVYDQKGDQKIKHNFLLLIVKQQTIGLQF